MAYTPELSKLHSGALRRIAWMLDKPMTKTLAFILENVEVDTTKVCERCLYKTMCKECLFGKSANIMPHENL